MDLSFAKVSSASAPAGTSVLFLDEESAMDIRGHVPPALAASLDSIETSSFRGKSGENFLARPKKSPAVLLCGIGPRDKLRASSLRSASASAVSICRASEMPDVTVFVPEIPGSRADDATRAVAEGLLLANYDFTRYKSKSAGDVKPLLKKAFFVAPPPSDRNILHETKIICENTLLCRDLVNENSDRSDAVRIASVAKSFTRIKGVKCTVLGKKEIEKLGMGLLLAVNRGSRTPPRLVVLTYRGDPGNSRSLAIVGKGITFDSGGINLKPSGHIETMRSDMAGAAAVLYAFRTAAQTGLRKNIHAVLPLTDNMLSAESYRPGDIIRAHNGTTVEIGNTDAEGRLILADAVSYTVSKLKPDAVIDMATLTGACLVTFGEIVAAYLSNDDGLSSLIEKASEATGEPVWQLPLRPEYEECIKSDFADLCNISAERNAGTIIGAAFIKNFVGDTPWAHIDIAGTSWFTKPRGHSPKYATGFGVRLLYEAIKNW